MNNEELAENCSETPTNDIDPAASAVASGTGGHYNSGANNELQQKDPSLSYPELACPVGQCSGIISMTSLLAHCLSDHMGNPGMKLHEVYADKPTRLTCAPATFKFQNNICLGILLYGGKNAESKYLPAHRGICSYNALLPKANENLSAHLPIMIMACRTSWSAVYPDKEIEAMGTDPDDVSLHFLIIWTVSVKTKKPVDSIITIYDQQWKWYRSSCGELRDIQSSQDPHKFLASKCSYMLLENDAVEYLTHRARQLLHLEVIICEKDD